eukprot:TRINITY_DN9043_c0_g1_i1.p1 TRINITY_DN9043_c0_g1~~TRINITY_DN9043_c0_g1_i1.p1  ORF type:complete len:135 (+),score=16.39 TRINITY_DN9043_c0_g1_i1:48-452(+)
MSFYGGHDVTLLFSSWVVSTPSMYALVIILTFMLCFSTNLVRDFVARQTKNHIAVRGVAMMLFFTMSSLCMLIMMSMNTGIFISIIAANTSYWLMGEITKKDKSTLPPHEARTEVSFSDTDEERTALIRKKVSP